MIAENQPQPMQRCDDRVCGEREMTQRAALDSENLLTTGRGGVFDQEAEASTNFGLPVQDGTEVCKVNGRYREHGATLHLQQGWRVGPGLTSQGWRSDDTSSAQIVICAHSPTERRPQERSRLCCLANGMDGPRNDVRVGCEAANVLVR